MAELIKTRNNWLRCRADFLAAGRATDLAWAAFRFDRGLQPTHWSVCGGGFVRSPRREGDRWRVSILRAGFRSDDDVAAEVIVDDRTGACDVTFNPAFQWDEDARVDRAPNLE